MEQYFFKYFLKVIQYNNPPTFLDNSTPITFDYPQFR